MTLKTEIPDVANLDQARDERRKPPAAQIAERVPAVGNPDAAGIVYFEGVLAFNLIGGMGSIVLTATRQLADATGQAFEDRIITGIIKAPLGALQQLRSIIDELERRLNDEAIAAVAALERPTGLPN